MSPRRSAMLVILAALGLRAGAADVPLSATVTVRADEVVRPVPPMWLGHNMEWVWQGQGLFEPDGSGPKAGVAQLIAALKPGLIRYPGGSLANTFRWERSVCPLERRKEITNFFEKKGEVPLLGFDDFMAFVRAVKAKGAMITVNGTRWPDRPGDSGTPQAAAAWVAYANVRLGEKAVAIGPDEYGTDWRDSQHWAAMRAANGHPEPWKVLHWEIGNEIYDSKQGAGMTPEEYVERAIAFARAMKAVDPEVRIGIIHWPQGGWADVPARAQERAPGLFDFRAVHDYAQSGRFLFNYHTGLRDTGDRTYPFTAAHAGRHTVRVRAWGRPLEGVSPRMEVRVDEAVLASVEVGSTRAEAPSEFTMGADLAPGEHTLTLRLLNAEPPEGRPYRDLYLHSISIATPGGADQEVDLNTLELLLLKAATTAERLMPAVRASARPTPDRLPFHRTEYAAMVGTDWPRCRDQKSAVLAARLAHANLYDPDCAGGEFWCIRSASFLILERGPDGAFRYSPAGIVHRALAELAEGEAVAVDYDAPTFRGAWLYVDRRCGWVAAAAARAPGRVAVNLVNYHPAQPARVTLRLRGARVLGRARTLAMVGPGPEAMNEDGKAPLITMEQGEIPAGQETDVFLAPCSVKTVVLPVE